ncbi:thermonuclease family protein [Bathymodiolus septemdierum thioautotrophic gill symbiont]|uniref:Nuclease domain protein n=1 Tax=endosymbiont of Bathymodiolus septemdierum str. Myojin knoll TaxID=1303921 RepID=A0A0P0UQF6_9GAMM|nr:thermonuclease family protein [Bathymodiolus septemdierum thioautotrophic gill symbiont]BAS67425.1 nuclease domain protein [endosymbiont of Bathymodiolus septemdierum str. Myojin knoll]
MPLFILVFLFVGSAFASIKPFALNSEKSLYIVDGDSISLQMRIANIDTPETRQTCQPTKDKIIDCGRLSKDYMKTLLTKTPGKITITPIAIGHYKRVLVKIYKGDIDIAKTMVEEGMAFAFGDFYKQEEELAKSKKVGFWGFYQPPIMPRKYRKSNPYQHK